MVDSQLEIAPDIEDLDLEVFGQPEEGDPLWDAMVAYMEAQARLLAVYAEIIKRNLERLQLEDDDGLNMVMAIMDHQKKHETLGTAIEAAYGKGDDDGEL